VQPHVDWSDMSRPEQLVLADAQTSGGLVMAVSEERSEHLSRALAARDVPGADIGRTMVGPAGHISVRGRL
jgi:selenide, water dikinase